MRSRYCAVLWSFFLSEMLMVGGTSPVLGAPKVERLAPEGQSPEEHFEECSAMNGLLQELETAETQNEVDQWAERAIPYFERDEVNTSCLSKLIHLLRDKALSQKGVLSSDHPVFQFWKDSTLTHMKEFSRVNLLPLICQCAQLRMSLDEEFYRAWEAQAPLLIRETEHKAMIPVIYCLSILNKKPSSGFYQVLEENIHPHIQEHSPNHLVALVAAHNKLGLKISPDLEESVKERASALDCLSLFDEAEDASLCLSEAGTDALKGAEEEIMSINYRNLFRYRGKRGGGKHRKKAGQVEESPSEDDGLGEQNQMSVNTQTCSAVSLGQKRNVDQCIERHPSRRGQTRRQLYPLGHFQQARGQRHPSAPAQQAWWHNSYLWSHPSCHGQTWGWSHPSVPVQQVWSQPYPSAPAQQQTWGQLHPPAPLQVPGIALLQKPYFETSPVEQVGLGACVAQQSPQALSPESSLGRRVKRFIEGSHGSRSIDGGSGEHLSSQGLSSESSLGRAIREFLGGSCASHPEEEGERGDDVANPIVPLPASSEERGREAIARPAWSAPPINEDWPVFERRRDRRG